MTPGGRSRPRLRHATASLALAITLVVATGPAPASSTIAGLPALGVWGTNGRVWAMARVGHVVYLGGDFSMALGPTGQRVPRANLAAIDTRTGRLTSWAPNANGTVYALTPRAGTIYVGGAFTKVKAQPRLHFAAVRLSGSLTALRVNAGALVRSLAVVGSTLYLGGRFEKVNGTRREHLASVDLSSGRLTPWHPSVNLAVRVIQPLPHGQLVIGGVFTVVNGRPERYLALFKRDGTLGSWADHPDPDRWVEDIGRHDGLIAVAEAGQGGRVQVFNERGVEQWRVFCNGDVQAIGFVDDKVIAGGHFLTVDQLAFPRLVALTLRGDVVKTWRPEPDKPVWSIQGSPGELYVGGEFLKITLGGRTLPVRRFMQFKVL